MNTTQSKDTPPLVIAVAPNGAKKTKTDHAALPVGPRDLALEAAACVESGAAMIHLHVRDAAGGHTLDADAYKAAIAAVRAEVGERIIIQVTSEAVGIYQPEEQMAMVREVRPEAVSLAVREICPPGFQENVVAEFLAWIAAERIMPQYIMYAADEVEQFFSLRSRGIVPDETPFILFVLGRYTTEQQSSPQDLLPFLQVCDGLPLEWSMCAFGAAEARRAISAVALDGHCRVGFENNLLLADGSVAANNSALVAQVRDAATLIRRPIADADTARSLLSRE